MVRVKGFCSLESLSRFGVSGLGWGFRLGMGLGKLARAVSCWAGRYELGGCCIRHAIFV